MSDDVGDNARLSDEPMKREKIGVSRLPEEGGHDRIAGEDGGSAVGIDRVASEERGLVEVVLADESEDSVVEVEAVSGEDGDGVGEFGGIRVRVYGAMLGLGVAEGVERGFDAEATLAAAPLGRGLFRGGKGKEAEREKGRWRMVVRFC